MATVPEREPHDFIVAVAGNPNSGKTTLFNALTGANARTGNYPGITVESLQGTLNLPDAGRVRLIDVPGSYSLTARSPDEEVAINALLGRKGHRRPDAVLVVLDATALERNLFLLTQILEFGLPAVAVVNMIDSARDEQLDLHLDAMRRELGIPVVGVVARRRQGIDLLKKELDSLLCRVDSWEPPAWQWEPCAALSDDLDSFDTAIREEVRFHLPDAAARRAFALWLLMSVTPDSELEVRPRLREQVLETRARIEAEGRDLTREAVAGRYEHLDLLTPKLMTRNARRSQKTERIDAVLTHPFWGSAIFLGIMGLIFQGLFSGSEPFIGLIEGGFGRLDGWLRGVLPPGLLLDLLTDGVLAGVGGVLVFLPQIVFLFFFVSVMEGTGYLSRAAFLIDRIMRKLGLHGQAFVPMLSGFACAIPAIMATRTIDNRRDRMLTILAVPLISCSARLPVYTLIIALLFPAADKTGFMSTGTLILLGIYVVSTLLALLAVGVLGKTVLKGHPRPLLLELPPYRLPDARTILLILWDRTRAFLTTAGTVILVMTIILWILLTFPQQDLDGLGGEDLARAQSEQLRDSVAGRIGTLMEPVIAPLGFDWKIGIGLIGSFAAREVFVSTMGVVYGVGDESDETDESLRQVMRRDVRDDGSPLWTPLTGLSLIVFFMIAMQCMSTLAVTRRETGSWAWTLFLLGYLTASAWLASFAVYQGGRLLGFA